MGQADADAELSKRTGQSAQTASFTPQGASLLTASTVSAEAAAHIPRVVEAD
jgi:hypothetical protein